MTNRVWKKVAVWVAASLMLVVLTGCDDGSTAATKEAIKVKTTTTTVAPTTTTRAPTTTTVAPTTTTRVTNTTLSDAVIELIYVDVVRMASETVNDLTWIDMATDDELITWGWTWCVLLDDYMDAETTYFAAAEYEADLWGDALTEDDMWLIAYVGGSATEAFCPHLAYLIEEW